jgi:hypothetical protein
VHLLTGHCSSDGQPPVLPNHGHDLHPRSVKRRNVAEGSGEEICLEMQAPTRLNYSIEPGGRLEMHSSARGLLQPKAFVRARWCRLHLRSEALGYRWEADHFRLDEILHG